MMSMTSGQLSFIITSFSEPIILSLHIQGSFSFERVFQSERAIEIRFNSFSNPSVFFPSLFTAMLRSGKGLLLGGHCSTISSALENFSGSRRERRERQQSVDGCVLCSITALTDSGKGRKWEGVKE